jgi:2-hydroxymuconate-semialdehyde hydrolase
MSTSTEKLAVDPGATMQEHSFNFDGISVHYLEGGTGFPILMIHGSGPGASTLGNWRLVLDPLAETHHVYAMDLIGFGKSERKPQPPYFDMPLWLAQCREMLHRIPEKQIGIIGHSISGALALKLAAGEHRVTKVMTTGSMGSVFPLNEVAERTWTFPRNREELRRTAEGLVYDKSLIDEGYLSNREKVLFSGDYEHYFAQMFAGDKRRFIDQALLSAEELNKVSCDVLMVHGRADFAFPAEPLTLSISRSIPQADIVLLGRCSHSIAFEHPDKFLALAQSFFRV